MTKPNARGVDCQGLASRVCFAWLGISEETLARMEQFDSPEQEARFDSCFESAEARHFVRWCRTIPRADADFQKCMGDGWGDDAWDACATKGGY